MLVGWIKHNSVDRTVVVSIVDVVVASILRCIRVLKSVRRLRYVRPNSKTAPTSGISPKSAPKKDLKPQLISFVAAMANVPAIQTEAPSSSWPDRMKWARRKPLLELISS